MQKYYKGEPVITTNDDAFSVYSAEERVVGIWRNGKPVYRQCFETINPPEMNAWFSYSISTPTDLDEAISLRGSVDSDGALVGWRTVPCNDFSLGVLKDGTLGCVFTHPSYVSRPINIVFEYTKTTDHPITGNVSPVFAYIEEYDQGNWHVRKWSSGYIEMTSNIPVPSPNWTVGSNNTYVWRLTAQPLPVALVDKQYENLSLNVHNINNAPYIGFHTNGNYSKTTTDVYFIDTRIPSSDSTPNVPVYLHFYVVGRWKEQETVSTSLASTPMIIPDFSAIETTYAPGSGAITFASGSTAMSYETT